jgi:hypothetical protein
MKRFWRAALRPMITVVDGVKEWVGIGRRAEMRRRRNMVVVVGCEV